MAKNINLFVNTGNEETNQKFEVVQGKATRVKAVKGARYQLQDPANKDVAPEIVKSKRVGKNLHVLFDGSKEADLIIEGYYDEEMLQGDNTGLYGRAENGQIYEYIPEDPTTSGLPINLADGGEPVSQVLGGAPAADAFALSGLPLVAAAGFNGLAAAAGVVGAAAVAGGGGAGAAGAGGGQTPAQIALAKIEAYNNGNGTTPAAPTAQDYADAGVTGVTANNVAAVNAQVLKQATGGADTAAELQALVTAANAALAKIEAYNNGNGITPPALTVQDYVDAGITGVTADNLAAVNANVLAQATGGADTVPEVQALVTAANNALAKIEAYNNGDGTTPAALTVQDYANAGVTGVTPNNLAVVNAKVLAQNVGGADTATEVQALVNGISDALAKIEAYNNGNGITPVALTVQDYANAGVTGVTADNLAAVNANVLAQNVGGADTTAEVQALVTTANNALAKIEAYNNGDGTTPAALTTQDYANAGVTGVTADNLAAVNAKVLAQSTGGADTAPEVQALVNGISDALAKIEAYNNGNGVTPVALTVQDYANAGITGVTADNLAAVNANVLAQATGGADTIPEVQALVTAANTALAKIEDYNNGNGTTPAALTPQDYANAGITGVTSNNVAAVNAKVLAQNAGGANTSPEVQAIVNDVNDAFVKIEAYNNGNGILPAALTLQDYANGAITGVTADNLAAVNAQVLKQATGGADTQAEVQALVTAANAALAKIEAYNNGNGTAPAALTLQDYADAGIVGVTAANLAAVNAAVLAANTGEADTVAEIQTLVSSAESALAKIEAYNNGDGTTPAALTTQDYAAAGVTGVTADNLAAVNAQVLKQATGGADTVPEVQALVAAANDALAKIEAYNNGDGTTPAALTLQDYLDAGITGVNANNLAAVNAKVLAQTVGGADTVPEVQSLVNDINFALVKIEAYNNGDGITPAPLTVQDYANAGITGVTADNLAAVNANVLAQNVGGADTIPEVQALVTAGNDALAKIEAYNNGNGTTPAALTVQDYANAGVTGVTNANLAAINAKVLAQNTGGADTTAEVQALVNNVSDALAKIEAYNNGNGITPVALTVQDYANAGITGVTADNIAAVNAKVLAQATGGADTIPEVQALVAAGNDALAKIEAYNNGNGTTPAALTLQDYLDAGITGVTNDNLAAVNAKVLAQNVGGADTAPEVQALVNGISDALAKIEAYNNGNGTTPAALTVEDYANAGITGVTASNLAAVNAVVLSQTTGGADTVAEVQALVTVADNALAKIEAYNNGDGTTPAALTAQDYANAGITGVTADNLAAVNANVLAQSTGGADTAPEVQALVAAANAALAKIEAYNNGNGVTPVALTVQDYANAGITGVTADNIAAVNAQVLKQAAGGADTAPDVQALVTAANAALAKIEAYNNGNGTIPAALTLQDYLDAGITGVTANNLGVVNAKVLAQNVGGADTAPEVQALVNTAAADQAAALTAISAAAQANDADGVSKATLTQYADLGVTGVDANNLAAINSALNDADVQGAQTDTTAKVQAIVDAYNAIKANADGTPANNATNPTQAQYSAIGVSGVDTAVEESLLGDVVDSKAFSAVDTVGEVQALADAVAAVMTGAAGGAAPTLAQLQALGITGATADNLPAILAAIAATANDGTGVDTLSELQSVVSNAATAAATAVNSIKDAAQANTAVSGALADTVFAAAGVTGVDANNLAAIQSALDSAAVNGAAADTTAKVQAIVDAYNAIKANADGTANNNATNPTQAQYSAIGVSGVDTAVEESLLGDVVDGKAFSAVDTVGEVQALADAVAAVMTGAAGGAAPTLAQLQALGITGATADNLPAILAAIAATANDGTGVDTLSELQSVVSNAATAAATAVNSIKDAAQANTAVSGALADTVFAAAGVTGVDANNLAAIQSALDSAAVNGAAADTTAEVQAIVDAVNAIKANADGTANNNATNPTQAQYTAMGVTGVDSATKESLLGDVVDGKAFSAVDTVGEVQALADAVAAVMTGAAGGAAPTLAQLQALGITGATADNLPAILAAIAATANDGTGVDTLSELQSVVSNAATAAATAVNSIKDAAQANTAVSGALADTVFAAAGVTGVDANNLAAIQSALDSAAVNGAAADTTAKVQAIVDAYNAIKANADGTPANNATNPTQAQYSAIGVSGVDTAVEESLLGDVVDSKAFSAVDTVGEVQALADAVAAVMTGAAGGAAPTLAQLQALGITGATADNLPAILAAIAATANDGTGVDTLSELQSVVSNAATAAATAVNSIKDAAQANTAVSGALADTVFAAAGVTGVDANNLAAIQSALDSAAVNGAAADTTAKVQAIVDAYKAILTEANDTANTTGNGTADADANSNPTVAQYQAIGVNLGTAPTDAATDAETLALLNAIVGGKQTADVDTVAEVQELARIANAIQLTAAGGTPSPALTVADLTKLGLNTTGVTAGNLPTLLDAIAAKNPDGTETDSLAELQALVDSLDKVAPTTPVSAPASYADNVGTITSTTSTAARTDDDTPGVLVGTGLTDTVSLYVDGVKVAATYNSVTGRITPTTPLTEGTKSITYTLTDASGNESGQSPAISITVDKTAAVVVSDDRTLSEDFVTATGNVSSNDTSKDGTEVYALVGANGSGDVSGTYAGLHMNSNGSYTLSPNTANIHAIAQNTDQAFSYTVTDAAGNTTTNTITFTFTPANDTPTGAVVITGTAKDGQVLTASTTEVGNVLADKDGLGTLSYKWFADGAEISGATGRTFTLTSTQVGKVITASVSYTDGTGNAESITSAATSAVTIAATAGDAVIDLGGSGKLIAPVQVEGKWYYYWDRSGNGVANDTDPATSHDVLDAIFKYDINGNERPQGLVDTTDVYRYATINGVQVALPTANGSLLYPDGQQQLQNGTAATSGVASTKFDEMLAIWDTYNGTGSSSSVSGTPTGWAGAGYYTATGGAGAHTVISMNNGAVAAGTTDSASGYYVALEVVTANAAPVLNASASPALTVLQGTTAGPTGAVGSLVSTLVSGITDSDVGAVKGIAITGFDSTNGTLYYSTDGGATWLDAQASTIKHVSTLSSTSALLLSADSDTRLYYKPSSSSFAGAAAPITFRAWDGTFSSEGAKVDASTVTGGQSAFSTNTDTIAINVASQLVNSDGSVTVGAASMSGGGYLGWNIANLGDVNGDGYDDVMLSEYANWGNSTRAYVVFGQSAPLAINVTAITTGGSAGFRITGDAQGDYSFWTMSGIGDINGDGLNDVAFSPPGNQSSGYVVYGKTSGDNVNLQSLGTQGFSISVENTADANGHSISEAGDVNGDGLADLIIGTSGGNRSYVVFGKTNNNSINLTSVTAGTGGFAINGGSTYTSSGYRVSEAGDVNGDGLSDLMVGATNGSGVSYVVFGKANTSAVDLNLIDAGNSTLGFVMRGESSSDQAYVVSNAGDVNGDGLADVIVGAYYNGTADGTGQHPGRAYVVFGKTSGSAINLADVANVGSTAGFAITGNVNTNVGVSVSAAGDINGDGLADVIVSAGKYYSPTDSYVVYGKASGTGISLTSLDAGIGGFKINGGTANIQDYLSSVTTAGDVNGDGFDDLYIGSRALGNGYAGGAYVIYGGSQLAAGNVDFVGDTSANTLTGTSTAETFMAGDGNDTLIGGGGADVMNGGRGNDTFELNASNVTALQNVFGGGGNITQLAKVDGGNGFDSIQLDAGVTLDLTAIKNVSAMSVDGTSRIHSIEGIDLSSAGASTVKIRLADVIDMSEMNLFHTGTAGLTAVSGTALGSTEAKHQVMITGDASDTADIGLSGWTNTNTVVGYGGHTYAVYNSANGAAAQLLIDQAMGQVI